METRPSDTVSSILGQGELLSIQLVREDIPDQHDLSRQMSLTYDEGMSYVREP